jgi:hypothetical protein
MVSVADVQGGRLKAGQQQEPIVQGGQVGQSDNHDAAWLQDPAGLPERRGGVFQSDEVAVPDHQIEMIIRRGKRLSIAIYLGEVGLGSGVGIAYVVKIIDDGSLWPDELIPEEQGLLSTPGLDLQQAAVAESKPPNFAGDLADDRPFNALMPSPAHRRRRRFQRSPVVRVGLDSAKVIRARNLACSGQLRPVRRL